MLAKQAEFKFPFDSMIRSGSLVGLRLSMHYLTHMDWIANYKQIQSLNPTECETTSLHSDIPPLSD